MKNKTILLLLIFTFFANVCEAVNIPGQEQAGGVEAQRGIQESDQELKEGIQKDRLIAPAELPPQEQVAEVPEGEKVLISKIELTGVTLLSAKDIRAVVSSFEGKELSLREMQDVANRITDLYRQKGYITTRAILPPQKVENGILKIEVTESRMGTVDVQGNKYFSTSLIKRKIAIKQGEPFNYNKLKANLAYLNRAQDRKVKTVLTQGKEPGTTDLVLNVKDKLPIHVGVAYDNYGSRYLKKNRYQGSLTHNNLLGFDDILTLTYQLGEGHNTYRLSTLRYLFPISTATQIGFYAGNTQLQLGKEFADIVARGKSRIYSVYLNHSLLTNDTTDVTLNVAFDYKDVFNFQLYEESNRDRLRVGRLGLKIDRTDGAGRTIINNEIDQGFPSQWAALKSKDPRASRVGSGGKFTKDILDVLRLQRMAKNSTLLLKAQAQFSSHVLTATEQYQIGGIANVRAYPSGEGVGDDGQSASAEWSFPVYFISKNVKAPGSKSAMLYDALRWAVFYDWGHVSLRNPSSAESKHRTLDGAGCGLRYDLPENFSVRVDVAWPLDETPSDETHAHTWLKVSKEF